MRVTNNKLQQRGVRSVANAQAENPEHAKLLLGELVQWRRVNKSTSDEFAAGALMMQF